MKPILFILFISGNFLFAQKEIKHTLDVDQNMKTIYFTMNSVFDIQLQTHTKNQITITAFSEGEYANYFTLNEIKRGAELDVTGEIAFIYPDFQDKLSAHKVHAVTVKIWVPEHLQIILKSDIGNMNVTGNYKSLITDADSGNCFIEKITGSIIASSVSGSIYIETAAGAVIAKSNLGQLDVDDIPKSETSFLLKTNKGNITVKKI